MATPVGPDLIDRAAAYLAGAGAAGLIGYKAYRNSRSSKRVYGPRSYASGNGDSGGSGGFGSGRGVGRRRGRKYRSKKKRKRKTKYRKRGTKRSKYFGTKRYHRTAIAKTKRKLRMTHLEKAMLHSLAPLRIVRAKSYQICDGQLNKQTYFMYDITNGDRASVVHGSYKRFANVFGAALNSTVATDWQGYKTLFWEKSLTFWKLANPCNHDIKVWIYEVIQNPSMDSNHAFSPLQELQNDLTNVNLVPTNQVNISTTYPVTYTAGTGTISDNMNELVLPAGVGRLETLMKFSTDFKNYYKIINKRFVVLGPGEATTYSQLSHYGRIQGRMFESQQYSQKSRYMLFGMEGFEATNEAGSEVGTMAPSLIVTCNSTDHVRVLDGSAQTKMIYLDNTVGGANEVGLHAANLTAAQVPGQYEPNVPAEND